MAQRDLLSIEVSENHHRMVMRLVGELDMASAPAVMDRLDDVEGPPLLLDLTEVTFMDSMGLSTVMRLATLCVGIEIIQGPRSVQRIFEITGTIDRFAWAG